MDQGFGFGSGWTLAMNSNTGQVGLYRNGSTNAVSSVTVDDDMWHHVVGTYDGTDTKVYVDGALVANVAGAATLGAGAANLRMGINQGGAEDFFGNMDEVAIYSRALSLADVQAHFAAATASAAIVPKPSTFGLTALGLLSPGFVGWRRRRR